MESCPGEGARKLSRNPERASRMHGVIGNKGGGPLVGKKNCYHMAKASSMGLRNYKNSYRPPQYILTRRGLVEPIQVKGYIREN